MKVYIIVESGNDGISVDGVFSTREKARKRLQEIKQEFSDCECEKEETEDRLCYINFDETFEIDIWEEEVK